MINKKIFFGLLALGVLLWTGVALAAPSSSAQNTRHLLPFTDGIYDVGTTTQAYRNGVFNSLSITGFTPCSVIFSDGTVLVEDNDNFCFDDTNNRLSVGTSTQSEASTLYVNTGTSTDHAMILRAATSQSAHIFMIEAFDGTDLFTVSANGETDIRHTAIASNELALDIEVDAAGFGGVIGLFIDYDTGAISGGDSGKRFIAREGEAKTRIWLCFSEPGSLSLVSSGRKHPSPSRHYWIT